jgi:hypothetical protein
MESQSTSMVSTEKSDNESKNMANKHSYHKVCNILGTHTGLNIFCLSK